MDDKLVVVVKKLEECQGEEVFKMTRVLFSIIRNLEKEGDVLAKLSTEAEYLPDATTYILHMDIGRRRVILGLIDDHTQKSQHLTIFESLSNKEALKRIDAVGK